MERDTYMQQALTLARRAGHQGEVPVGCVVVDKEGRIIGRGQNRRQAEHDATAHAEIEAIREACRAMGDWRLEGCSLYVTLEPCPMCAGAIVNARIPRVIYGAKEENFGCCGSVLDLFYERFGHRPAVFGGVGAEESSSLLRSFFQEKRDGSPSPSASPSEGST